MEENLEETQSDLIEVKDVAGEAEERPGTDHRKGDDLILKPLTERMIYLMQKISEYGYLTRPEVELIYSNQTHGYRVLGVLRDKGLIGDFKTERQPKRAVYLKPKGYRTLEKFGRLRLKRRFLPQQFKPFIFDHRLACARVGLLLESHALATDFLPESLLWERAVRKRQKLCDGEFVYRAPNQKPERVGLEVELSLKSRDNLSESLRALKEREDLAQVWWLCGDGVILRALKTEVLHGYRDASPRHLFCSMADFMSQRHQARLADAEGAEFKIDPKEPTLRPLAEPARKDLTVLRAEAISQPKPEGSAWDLRRERDLEQYEQSLFQRAVERLRTEAKPPPTRRRWIMAALGACALIGAAGFALFELPTAPPPPRERPWRVREILNAQEIRNQRGTWIIKRLSLRSRGDSYRMSLSLLNPDGYWCGLMGLKVMDAERRILGALNLKGGEWIYAHHSWEGGLGFRASRDAKQVLLGITSGGWDCGDMEFPVVHN